MSVFKEWREIGRMESSIHSLLWVGFEMKMFMQGDLLSIIHRSIEEFFKSLLNCSYHV